MNKEAGFVPQPDEGPVLFGDRGMLPNENAQQQLREQQVCLRCGKRLEPPYETERFVYCEDWTTKPPTVDMYGFGCTDCQRIAPDYDWLEEE